MTDSPVKSQPGRPPKQKRGTMGTLERQSKEEIFDRNISIAWEESVLYAPRNIDYVPEGEFLKRLMEENSEFSEEEIIISFRKLNEEAKRIFEENKEMIEADKPVQQETMFWGSMAELNELESVQDREIKVWLLEHPPSQCTRKRPAPKRKLVPKEPERTDLTEEEKAARVTDLIDSVSKGETSQDYTPDSFPTLMELRMISDVVPPKIPKVPKVPKVAPPTVKHPLSYSKTNTIPMLLAGAQIGGAQSGPTVAEYLKSGKFAVQKRPNDPNDWVSVLQSGLGSGSDFGQCSASGFSSGPNSGSSAASGLTVGEYLNQKLLTEGLIPAFASGSAFDSGSALGSGSSSGSGLRHQKPAKVMEGCSRPNEGSGPALSSGLAFGSGSVLTSRSGTQVDQPKKPQDHQEVREEQAREALGSGLVLGSSGSALGLGSTSGPNSGSGSGLQAGEPEKNDAQNHSKAPQEDHAPHPSDSDPSPQDPNADLEEDRDLLETSNSSPLDGSQAQRDEVSQEDLDALRLAAGYRDLGPQYDDDGAQNYFYPEDDFFEEDQGGFEPQNGSGAHEDPEQELDNLGSVSQDGSQAVDGVEDPEVSGTRQMPAEEDHGEDLGPQEEAGADSEPEPEYDDDNRQDSAGSSLEGSSQAQEDHTSDLAQMPVKDLEMNSGSGSNEDPAECSEPLEDAQGAKSPGNSGSGTEASSLGTEDLGSGAEASGPDAVPEMAAEHPNPLAHEDEDLELEEQEAELGPGTQNDFGLQDRLGPQEDQDPQILEPGSGYQDVVPNDHEPQNYYIASEDLEPEQQEDEEPQENFEPREHLEHQDQAGNDAYEPQDCQNQDSEPVDQEVEDLGHQEGFELQDNQGSLDQNARELQASSPGLDSGRQDLEDQYKNDEVDTFGLEDLDEEDSERWGDEEEDSVHQDQDYEDFEHPGSGLASGYQDLRAQYKDQRLQDYYEARGEEDDELKDQEKEEIELQEVREPELPGSLVGRQDFKPQRPHIELQEYQDPNLTEPEPMDPTGPLLHWSKNVNFGAHKRLRTPEPEVEPQPKQFSPERGHYSGIPVWEMYQRAKKMFEDLAKKEALRSSGQLQESSEDDDEESFGSESPTDSSSSSAALIPTAHEQECHEDDDEDFIGCESPQSTRDSASSSAAPIPTACVQVNSEDDDGEFYKNGISQMPRDSTPRSATPIPEELHNDFLETPELVAITRREKTPEEPAQEQENDEDDDEESFESESPRASSSECIAPVPTGSESPNAEEPLIYDHDYLHKIEYEIAAMQANDIIFDDVYEDDQGSHSPRNSSPIPTAPTPEALEPDIYDADDDEEFSEHGSRKTSRGSSPIPAASSPAREQQHIDEHNVEFSEDGSRKTSRDCSPIPAAPSPAHEQQHFEEHDVEFSENVSLQRSRESSPIPAVPCPAHVQVNYEKDDEESFESKSPQSSRSSPSSSAAYEQGNNEEDDGELSDHGSPRAATPVPEDPHNNLLEIPEPIVIARREKTPELPVGFPPGYEELLLNYSPFRATLKLIERQLRLPLTPEELANLLEDARRNSMSQSSQEPKRKRCRFF